MKVKPLFIIVAVLAAASGITWFLTRPPAPPPADPRVGKPLLDTAIIQKTARVEVAEAGKSVAVSKGSDGTWEVPDYFNLPAGFSKLSSFLGDFSGLNIERLVSTNPDRISRLGFADSTVTLKDASGSVLWKITLGAAAEDGGHFVRFGDEDKAYFARLNTYFDTQAFNWVDQQVIKLTAADIARVELNFPEDNGATFVATRPNKDASFAPQNPLEGRPLRLDAVPNLVNSFSALRFSWSSEANDPDAAAAREANLRRLKLTTFSGVTYTVEMAPKIQPPAEDKPAAEGDQAAADSPTNSVPVGPVYLWVSSSDPSAPVNELMKRRTFHMNEYLFASVPKTVEAMYEPAAAAAAPGN